jgi:hypothetical protein
MLRLSGFGIRNTLYLGTAPGNLFLAVSTTKGGLAPSALREIVTCYGEREDDSIQLF